MNKEETDRLIRELARFGIGQTHGPAEQEKLLIIIKTLSPYLSARLVGGATFDDLCKELETRGVQKEMAEAIVGSAVKGYREAVRSVVREGVNSAFAKYRGTPSTATWKKFVRYAAIVLGGLFIVGALSNLVTGAIGEAFVGFILGGGLVSLFWIIKPANSAAID